MSLWPKEHGAYGQVGFPLITALGVVGVSVGGTLTALTVLAGFLAHEPAAVVLGLRGSRTRRQRGASAAKWLLALFVIGGSTGLGAIWAIAATARWSLLIPALPALVLAFAMRREREKSWYAEVSAALAFSGAAVPVTMAAGGRLETAAVVAIPFALLFVTGTLAVRVVVLSVRGGGNRGAAGATRHATIALSAGAGTLLALAAWIGLLSPSIGVVAAPGLLTTASIALRPPSPARLRRVGWTLVAVSVITAALAVSIA
jgi:YwiC-like protein